MSRCSGLGHWQSVRVTAPSLYCRRARARQSTRPARGASRPTSTYRARRSADAFDPDTLRHDQRRLQALGRPVLRTAAVTRGPQGTGCRWRQLGRELLNRLVEHSSHDQGEPKAMGSRWGPSVQREERGHHKSNGSRTSSPHDLGTRTAKPSNGARFGRRAVHRR